ncbi:hypothetical protein EON64_13085, partial [archaeon]
MSTEDMAQLFNSLNDETGDQSVSFNSDLNTAKSETPLPNAHIRFTPDPTPAQAEQETVAEAQAAGQQPVEGVTLSSEQENMLMEFCSITAAELSAARNVLEATNWDLQSAL